LVFYLCFRSHDVQAYVILGVFFTIAFLVAPVVFVIYYIKCRPNPAAEPGNDGTPSFSALNCTTSDGVSSDGDASDGDPSELDPFDLDPFHLDTTEVKTVANDTSEQVTESSVFIQDASAGSSVRCDVRPKTGDPKEKKKRKKKKKKLSEAGRCPKRVVPVTDGPAVITVTSLTSDLGAIPDKAVIIKPGTDLPPHPEAAANIPNSGDEQTGILTHDPSFTHATPCTYTPMTVDETKAILLEDISRIVGNLHAEIEDGIRELRNPTSTPTDNSEHETNIDMPSEGDLLTMSKADDDFSLAIADEEFSNMAKSRSQTPDII
jgi:hypothetical protein